MKNPTYHIIRVSMAITFLWIGVLIFRDPEDWGGLLQPWAMNLIMAPLKETMIATAILDMLVGVFLLVDFLPWLAALVGSVHLVIVMATTGISVITVRDIGLLGGTIAIMATTWPATMWPKKSKNK